MSSKDYRITPPPKEKDLYRVIYEIDIGARSPRQAAETAWQQMMRAEDAFDPVLTIIDSSGKQTKLDLSELLEFNKVTTGFVIQRYRKNSDGKFTCIDQEFIAGDDVQFENAKGKPIEAPEHEYQPFNMTMLSKDQLIDRLGDVLTSIDVGGEQSRQFSNEIKILDELLKDLGWARR